MILIWPVGVPCLYAYSFWLNWPTIGRLRRAEMRMEAATSVRQLRRASVNQAHLQTAQLLVSLKIREGSEEKQQDADRDPELHEALHSLSCQVVLMQNQLKITAPVGGFGQDSWEGASSLTLALTQHSKAQLSDNGKSLSVTGDFAAGLIDGATEAVLTLEDPTAQSGSRTTRGSSVKLREWRAAVSGQIPDVEVEDVEYEIKKLYLTPILLPYELRCFWWEIFECIRKLSLVGLPVFFEPGSTGQLMFGLLICFLTVHHSS